MSNQGPARIGPVFWIAQMLMLLLTAGVTWLYVLDPQMILLAFVVMGIGGLALNILVALTGGGGGLRPAPFGFRQVIASVAGFFMLIVFNMLIQFLFGVPITESPAGSAAAWEERILVNVLFAIYEENMMFAVFQAGKVSGMRDIFIIIISTIVFIPLHAWVRALDILFVLFLAIGRSIFTGIYAMSDHSDPGYIIHILWNVINT